MAAENQDSHTVPRHSIKREVMFRVTGLCKPKLAYLGAVREYPKNFESYITFKTHI